MLCVGAQLKMQRVLGEDACVVWAFTQDVIPEIGRDFIALHADTRADAGVDVFGVLCLYSQG